MIEPNRLARRAGALAALAIPALVLTLALGQSDATDATVDAPDRNAVPSPTDTKPLEYEKWQTNTPGEHLGYNRRANLVQRGHDVYNKYCVGCHGESGDGNGPAAVRLITKPRDFTSGIFKFRSTESGNLPLETDLYRVITRGLARVSMPSFPLMPERDKIAVVEYIKGFYPRWEEEKSRRAIVAVPRAPADLAEPDRVLRGHVVYLTMSCNKCHGVDGRGTGATQTEYTDAWGNSQKPFNFTRGSLKGGNTPEDIYRTFHTGLQSVMPSFGGDTLAMVTSEGFPPEDTISDEDAERLMTVIDQFPPTGAEIMAMSGSDRLDLVRRNSWDLVGYIISLRDTTTTAEAVLGPLQTANR